MGALPEDVSSGTEQTDSYIEFPSIHDSFASNPDLTFDMRALIKPFLLPESHSMKKPLDVIFHTSRATKNKIALCKAGFNILFQQKRSFICVVRHPDLPGYLLKLYTDNDLRQKHEKPGWQWLVRRCEGARKIKGVIHHNKIQNFQVPRKWLYPLPQEPSPSISDLSARNPVVLLVEDMHLTSKKENLLAWKKHITKKHLDELYTIISRGRGSSYRPDNIHYSKNGKFSFIDTEYPNRGPDFNSIRKYLSKNMCDYWDKLVKHEGHVPY